MTHARARGGVLAVAATFGLLAAGWASTAVAGPPCDLLRAPNVALTPATAQACLLEKTRLWGPDDPRLVTLATEAADRLAVDKAGAALALPMRHRAAALARRIHGPRSQEAADAALAHARALLLSGHCRPGDRRSTPLLETAQDGYAALPADASARADGLRATARAFSDALAYAPAAETLERIGPAGLAARDWRLIGDWRRLAGDPDAAVAAYGDGLAAAMDARERARLIDRLKKLHFARGDLDALKALRAFE